MPKYVRVEGQISIPYLYLFIYILEHDEGRGVMRKRKREVKRKSEREKRDRERTREGEKYGAVANVATLSLPASSEHVRSVNSTTLPREIAAAVDDDDKKDNGLAATLPAKHRSDMSRIRAERRRPRDRFYQRRPTSNVV